MFPSTWAFTPPMTESNTSVAPGLITYPAASLPPAGANSSSALLISTAFTAALPPGIDCAKVNGRNATLFASGPAIDTWTIGLLTSMARLSEIFDPAVMPIAELQAAGNCTSFTRNDTVGTGIGSTALDTTPKVPATRWTVMPGMPKASCQPPGALMSKPILTPMVSVVRSSAPVRVSCTLDPWDPG